VTDQPSNAAVESGLFWQAAAEGRLLFKRCLQCGEAHHYPRDICPHCLSTETQWQEASGLATVYSLSHVSSKTNPYTVAYVRLDEGITMMTNLVGHATSPGDFHIGQRVRVTFVPGSDGRTIPMFTHA
jgi:uncharacterized OB-fold protein